MKDQQLRLRFREYKMKTDARLKKLPHPEVIFLKTGGNKQVAICPKCNAWVQLRAKKKDGTASGFEYANHYERLHL